MITRLHTFSCYFVNENNRQERFNSLREAMLRAEKYVGNRSYARPIPNENTFFYGPGDGTTSVLIREDIEFS